MAHHKGFADGIARSRNGRWKLFIRVNKRRIKRTFSTREEAERVRDNLRGRQKLQSLGVPLAQKAAFVVKTVGSVLDAYALERETLSVAAEPRHDIQQAKAYFVAWCGEHREADLTRKDLVDFVGWMKKNTNSKGRVIHNAIVILRTAFKLADIPVPPKPPLELPERQRKTLAKADVEKLLRELPLGSVARTAVEIGLRTAARESEIRRIRVGDVDLSRETLVLRRGKGKRGRRGSEEIVPLPQVLVKVLRAYMIGLPADLATDAPLLAVESTRRGVGAGRHALFVGSLRRELETACKAAGVPTRTTVGWTRAEATTLGRENGATLREASLAAGHADERVTLDHYDESEKRTTEKWDVRRRVGAQMDRILPFVGPKSVEKVGVTLGTLVSESDPSPSLTRGAK